MEDTPEHIKELQLKIWLAKTPGERLLQTITDNEALFLFWKAAKAELAAKHAIQSHQEDFAKRVE